MDAAFLTALGTVFAPMPLVFLALGVLVGLVLGVIPGLSGIFGMALLVPLTYGLDPVAAIALLLGMGSVTTTSDTIPAVLLGVPGTVGSTATVEDGFPLAKQGQASRAFGAAYSASLIGGLFGACVLAASVPVMRPLILSMRTPDFLAISVLGLMCVAMLAGANPIKGGIAVLLGLLVSTMGLDGQTATERYTFGALYLWDGVPLAAVFLGIFGLPELAGLLRRKTIAAPPAGAQRATLGQGLSDTAREWRLVLQSSTIGSVLGAVPGIGVAVIDWIAYGAATRHRRGGPAFGTGNIRGVIASESANNAKEGGALIPTIAFGLPGSASMSILLGAFVVHGIVPGPQMLTSDLSITYAMVITIALANVIATGLCLGLTGQLAKLAQIRVHALVPVALVFVILGAFQTTRSLGDIAVLLAFGALGMMMKSLDWPRAPFALGFVLGPMIERYFFLSQQLTGWGWLTRPSILLVFALFAALILWQRRTRRADPTVAGPPLQRGDRLACWAVALVALAALFAAMTMPFGARLFPTVVGGLIAVTALIATLRRGPPDPNQPSLRAEARILGAALVFTCLLLLAGPYLASFGLVAGLMLLSEGQRPLSAVLTGAGTTLFVFVFFGQIMSLPWPDPWLFYSVRP